MNTTVEEIIERYSSLEPGAGPEAEVRIDGLKLNDMIAVCREAKELQQLFDIQWKRMSEATKLWREATARREVYPDLGELLKWLMGRITELEMAVLNQAGDNHCWFDPQTAKIPPAPEFFESCRRYHGQIAVQNGVLDGARTIAQLEARGLKLELALKSLRQYEAAEGRPDGDEIRIGLASGSTWGPLADPKYEMYELAEAVATWLHQKCDEALGQCWRCDGRGRVLLDTCQAGELWGKCPECGGPQITQGVRPDAAAGRSVGDGSGDWSETYEE